MKDKIAFFFSLLEKLVLPISSAIIGLKLVGCFNFIQKFGLVNDSDKAFDICTTIYFTILDGLLLLIVEKVRETYFAPQAIIAMLSKPGEMVNHDTFPDIVLQDETPKEVLLTINIDATKSVCRGLKLTIEGINFATMQLPEVNNFAGVDAMGNFVVELERLFGNQEQAKTSQTFRILFLREPVAGICQSELRPIMNREPLRISYKSNKIMVRTEG